MKTVHPALTMNEADENSQLEERICSQERTIEMMLSLKEVLREDINIQRELISTHGRNVSNSKGT